MVLSGNQILREAEEGRITIDPFTPETRLNPNSYNLRLHSELLTYGSNCDHKDLAKGGREAIDIFRTNAVIDMKHEPITQTHTIAGDGMWLLPNRIYLGRTVEYTATDYYVPMIEGRSSIGRLGMNIHITAGFGDVGFAGHWTLEITVTQPLKVYAGIDVCQIYFHTVEDIGERRYRGSYNNRAQIKPSKIHREVQALLAERSAKDDSR